MSKDKVRLSKSDARYWQERVFKPTYTRNGERIETANYSVRIAHAGRREVLPLHVGKKAEAGKRAKEVYQLVVGSGWDIALAKYKPASVAPKEEKPAFLTVGDYIREVEGIVSISAQTLSGYKMAFRRIVADAKGIKRVSYNGERYAWKAKVDAVKLDSITPRDVQRWKVDYVKANGGDPARDRKARMSANTNLRQAKSLFGARKVLSHVRHLPLPSPLPFDGVEFYPRESMRYVSTVDVRRLLSEGIETLAHGDPEAWKVLLLAIGAGLRRKEIDTLLWRQVDFERGLIRIEATQYFKPKSEDSAGEVEIEDELMAILRGYHSRATGEFVIEANNAPKPNASYSYTRSKGLYKRLYKWLREHGVESSKPLHTLRKEFGSMICNESGLYAASRALRHADIAVTASHYLDKKERVTVGIGGMLSAQGKVESMKQERRAG